MDVERRLQWHFHKALRDYRLIEDGDKVLVGLSGGKDSLCLLEFLARRSKVFRPKFSVEALHVRMENIQYESDTVYLQQFCDNLGVPLHIITTRFDDTQHTKPACFLCSWQRRKQLFNLAQELGCNKIALGHHQDDLIHTALMNLTFQGHFSSMPPLLKMDKMPLSIIRPLCLCQEADIEEYASIRKYEKQLKRCPYEKDTNRTTVHELFDRMQQMNAEARYSIWNALESAMKLRPMMLLLMLLISMGVSAQRRKQHRQKVAPPTEQSEQMKRMTESTQRIMFIDSVVLPKKDILKAYPVSAEVGRLAPYSTFFPQSKSQTLTYMNELGNRCLYNDTDSTLAYRERLLQTWSPADTLAGINSDHQFRHIRYPFMMTDGITLYFAAQGEGSIGGYDIFMTTYDAAEGRFLKPENIGMPFNSTANDYLFVIDEYNQLGYFATDRLKPDSDSVCVYTFIPAKKYQTYDAAQYAPEQIAAYARIADISQTWDNQDALASAQQRLEKVRNIRTKKREPAFSFVINNQTVYHELHEFKAPGNQERYNKLVELKQRYQQVLLTLEKNRAYYHKATANEKDALTRDILDGEQIQHELYSAIQQQEIDIRQAENNYLTKK